jgi:hypothetical protein
MADPSSQSSLFEIEAADLSWQKIVTPAALEAVARDRGQIIGFLGHRGLFALGHYLMAWRLLQDESVILVEGANVIDLPLILKLTDGLKANRRQLLNRLHLSRAFTVHQLEAVICERLEKALQKYQSRLCFVSGLLDTFYDDEVPVWESMRILRKTTEKLRALADQGCRLILLAPDPPTPTTKRKNLVPLVTEKADRIFALGHEKNQYILIDDTKAARDKKWVLPSIPFSIRRSSPR